MELFQIFLVISTTSLLGILILYIQQNKKDKEYIKYLKYELNINKNLARERNLIRNFHYHFNMLITSFNKDNLNNDELKRLKMLSILSTMIYNQKPLEILFEKSLTPSTTFSNGQVLEYFKYIDIKILEEIKKNIKSYQNKNEEYLNQNKIEDFDMKSINILKYYDKGNYFEKKVFCSLVLAELNEFIGDINGADIHKYEDLAHIQYQYSTYF